MTHGDNRGLKMPPRVAPIQVVILPIAFHKEGVLDKAYELKKELGKSFRVEIDSRDEYSAGWKFNYWEMKGVPVRLEVGPRDIENNQVTAVRRDTLEKFTIPMDELNKRLGEILNDIQDNMFKTALENREEKTFASNDYEEIKDMMKENKGFIKIMWCGSDECEAKLKADTSATIRCIPLKKEKLGDKCAICGKDSKHMVVIGKAY